MKDAAKNRCNLSMGSGFVSGHTRGSWRLPEPTAWAYLKVNHLHINEGLHEQFYINVQSQPSIFSSVKLSETMGSPVSPLNLEQYSHCTIRILYYCYKVKIGVQFEVTWHFNFLIQFY